MKWIQFELSNTIWRSVCKGIRNASLAISAAEINQDLCQSHQFECALFSHQFTQMQPMKGCIHYAVLTIRTTVLTT